MSLNVRQCKRCRKIFQYQGNPVCQSCIIELDKDFDLVRNYMYDNPKSTIDTVCDETGVSRECVTRWLREGRLILSSDSVALLNCEKCGKPIISGKFCPECTQSVKTQFESTARTFAANKPAPKKPPEDDRNGPRMHVGIGKR